MKGSILYAKLAKKVEQFSMPMVDNQNSNELMRPEYLIIKFKGEQK